MRAWKRLAWMTVFLFSFGAACEISVAATGATLSMNRGMASGRRATLVQKGYVAKSKRPLTHTTGPKRKRSRRHGYGVWSGSVTL